MEGTGGAFDFYELGFPLFDDNQNLFSPEEIKEKNMTIKKYQNKIDHIKNDKIKKSLIELTKVYKQKWKK